MKILVTGATGFIGSHLCSCLLKEGHEVWAIVRSRQKEQLLQSRNIRTVFADICESATLAPLEKEGFQAVFHCAASVSDNNPVFLNRTNVLGTENICRFCIKSGVSRLIYVSSVAVIHGHSRMPLTDDLPYNPSNNYGRSKTEAEKAVLQAREKGLKCAVFRPCMVYGEGEPHALDRLLTLMKMRIMPLLGTGQAKWHLVYVKNLVQAMALALTDERLYKGTFIVADKEVLSVKEKFECLRTGLNARPSLLQISASVARVLRWVPGLSRYVRILTTDRIYDISHLESIGFKPVYKAQDALISTGRHWAASGRKRR